MPAEIQASKPRIDLSRYELTVDRQRVKLERQPMELLIFLVQRLGLLVTRNDIIEKLWGQDVFVDVDGSINAAVRKIRSALKDDPTSPKYLETVVGKGYRFIGNVELIGGAQPSKAPHEAPP
jgi:DNA-binding winged helix-turn-helix (wHTH) protein